MSRGSAVLTAMIVCAVIALLAGGAVAAAPVAAKGQAAATDAAAVAERVDALQKENVVLREDLGKARLDAKTQLEAAAKRQAEALARLQKELDETQAQMQADRDKQARRNRNLWYAVGALAVGILLTN